MIASGSRGVSSFKENKEKHYFIEQPFRIQHLSKKISKFLVSKQVIFDVDSPRYLISITENSKIDILATKKIEIRKNIFDRV